MRVLVFSLVVLFYSTTGFSQQTIKIPQAQRDQLKLLGKVGVQADGKATEPIQLGSLFVDQSVRGRIHVQNNTGRQWKVKGLRTSCGCTAAYSKQEQVGIGGTTELLVAMKASKAEKIAVRLTLQTNQGDFPIPLVGSAKLKIDLPEKRVELRPNQEFIDLTFQIHHPKIDPNQVGLLIAGQRVTRVKVEHDQVTFRLDADRLSTDSLMRLVPTVGGVEQRPVQLQVRRKGMVRLATQQVFGSRDESGSFRFRLFLAGDMSVIDAALSRGSLRIGEEVLDAEIKTRILNNTALMQCRVDTKRPLDDEHATLEVGNQSFLFTLRTR